MKCPYCKRENPTSATRCLHCRRLLPLRKGHGRHRHMKSALLNGAIVIGTIVLLFAFLIGGIQLFRDEPSTYTGMAYRDDDMCYEENVYELAEDEDDADDEIEDTDNAAEDNAAPAQEEAALEAGQKAEGIEADDEQTLVGAQKNAAVEGSVPELLADFFDSETGVITLPDSHVKLTVPFDSIRSVDASTSPSNPTILLSIETESGLLYNVDCYRLDVTPDTLVDTEQSAGNALYASIGGEDLFYYYVFQPSDAAVMGNIVDVDNCWMTQITITDLDSSSSSASPMNARPYRAILNLLSPLIDEETS